MEARFCESCGAALTPGDEFCSECGQKVGVDAPVGVPSPTAQPTPAPQPAAPAPQPAAPAPWPAAQPVAARPTSRPPRNPAWIGVFAAVVVAGAGGGWWYMNQPRVDAPEPGPQPAPVQAPTAAPHKAPTKTPAKAPPKATPPKAPAASNPAPTPSKTPAVPPKSPATVAKTPPEQHSQAVGDVFLGQWLPVDGSNVDPATDTLTIARRGGRLVGILPDSADGRMEFTTVSEFRLSGSFVAFDGSRFSITLEYRSSDRLMFTAVDPGGDTESVPLRRVGKGEQGPLRM